MAVVVIAEVPGGTAEMDQAIQQTVASGGLPSGSILRAAGPIPGGWRVLSVWESADTFTAFYQERLGPALQQAGRQPPTFTIWPVERVQSQPR